MKKIISAALAAMMVISMTACGSSTPAPAPAPEAPATEAPATEAPATEAPTPEAPEPAGWVPTENIEVVIPFSAGGGSDIFARKIVEIIETKKLAPVTVIPNNKPGGSGVVGYTYLSSKGDNPHVLATTSSSFYTQPLSGNSPLSCYESFSFVSHLCKDPTLVAANPSKGFADLQGMIDFAKANPGALKFGGTSNASDDAILMHMFNKLVGVELVYVPYDSGAEVLAAVLGGHIDLCAISPSEAGEHLTAGTLQPLAVSADDRLDTIPDVPTFLENDIDINHQQSRGVVMNAGVAPEAVAYYSDLMRQVTETDEWKSFLADNIMMEAYMPTDEYTAFNNDLADDYTEFLTLILEAQ